MWWIEQVSGEARPVLAALTAAQESLGSDLEARKVTAASHYPKLKSH